MIVERFKLICLLIAMAMVVITSIIMAYFRPKLENIKFEDFIIISFILIIANAFIFCYRFTVPI